MKAIVQDRYGRPEHVLELRDIDKPVPCDNEVLVRVRAASVHPDVWHVVRGWPYLVRIMGAGLRKPKVGVPGTDLAGQVETVGKNVTEFRPGDEVFGEITKGHQWHNGGAYAEYAAVRQDKLELKPASVTFQQAAAVPTSGLLAYQGIRREGRLQHGQTVLINGAGGAVGTFAVQLASAYGAEVTAVDNTQKQDMLRSIGADHVIDYRHTDFTLTGERYDLILDIPGNRTFEDLKRAVADNGRYVLIGHDNYGASGNRWIGGSIGRFLRLLIFAPFGRSKTFGRAKTFGRSKKGQRTNETRKPLAVLKDLLAAGDITPVIDRTFPLSEVPDAIRYLEEGHAGGKVIISI